MKRILLFLVFVVIGYTAGAQLKDLMKNKANSMLNKGSKTESTKSSTPTSDSTANKAGTSTTSGSADQQGAKSNGGWGGFSMGSKSDIAAEYNFAHNMHIEMESVKKGETSGEKHQMVMYMGKDNSNYSGVEMKTDPKKPDDKMISVYEYEKTQSVTYMHSDGKKSVMVSKYNSSATDTGGPRWSSPCCTSAKNIAGLPARSRPGSLKGPWSSTAASRGVDVILGAHSHMVQPIVPVLQYSNWKVNDTYVAYSLGNFLSGQRWRYTDSGLIAYVHIEKQGLKTRVAGIRYLTVYVQKTTGESVDYRILPVLPGLGPQTDTTITQEDTARMDQVWEELTYMLYRPDEGIVPLDPTDLGIEQ